MAGTVPVSGHLSIEDLGDALSYNEQTDFVQVTGLAINPMQVGNLVTTISQPNQLGTLTLVATGAAATGTRIFSAITVYISGVQTVVDVYRGPLAE